MRRKVLEQGQANRQETISPEKKSAVLGGQSQPEDTGV